MGWFFSCPPKCFESPATTDTHHCSSIELHIIMLHYHHIKLVSVSLFSACSLALLDDWCRWLNVILNISDFNKGCIFNCGWIASRPCLTQRQRWWWWLRHFDPFWLMMNADYSLYPTELLILGGTVLLTIIKYVMLSKQAWLFFGVCYNCDAKKSNCSNLLPLSHHLSAPFFSFHFISFPFGCCFTVCI